MSWYHGGERIGDSIEAACWLSDQCRRCEHITQNQADRAIDGFYDWLDDYYTCPAELLRDLEASYSGADYKFRTVVNGLTDTYFERILEDDESEGRTTDSIIGVLTWGDDE